MRYLIKFTKDTSIKFVAHLDLMRSIQRTITRSGIVVSYSKGFNPHMHLSLAQPLAVGMYSSGDYMDVDVIEEIEPEEFIKRFNAVSPNGIKVVAAAIIPEPQMQNERKVPQAMAALYAAGYRMKIKYEDDKNVITEMKALLNKEKWEILKKSKKGEAITDIKPMVKKIYFTAENNILEINCIISCGSRENLSSELFGIFIKENTSNVKLDAFVDVERTECYGLKYNRSVPIIEALT